MDTENRYLCLECEVLYDTPGLCSDHGDSKLDVLDPEMSKQIEAYHSDYKELLEASMIRNQRIIAGVAFVITSFFALLYSNNHINIWGFITNWEGHIIAIVAAVAAYILAYFLCKAINASKASSHKQKSDRHIKLLNEMKKEVEKGKA